VPPGATVVGETTMDAAYVGEDIESVASSPTATVVR
jgi:hypothetical protein